MGEARILVTGASGTIGRTIRTGMAGRPLRLLDVVPPAPPEPGEDVETVTASVTDLDAMTEASRGAAAVVHLGGIATEGPWADVLDVNIDGTRAVLEAARLAGVPRVVLASSNHAAGFRTRAEGDPLPAGVGPRPDTYYGVAKVAMEGLGSLYHDRFGMDVVCLRIGTMREAPADARALATWLSPGDVTRLVEASLAAPSPGFRIVWGISRNTRRWWSLAEGEEIGYHPEDDAEEFASEIIAENGEPDTAADIHFRVGGGYTTLPLGTPD
jgi:nucleoside-diphosphate-sugar epimerase